MRCVQNSGNHIESGCMSAAGRGDGRPVAWNSLLSHVWLEGPASLFFFLLPPNHPSFSPLAFFCILVLASLCSCLPPLPYSVCVCESVSVKKRERAWSPSARHLWVTLLARAKHLSNMGETHSGQKLRSTWGHFASVGANSNSVSRVANLLGQSLSPLHH